MFDKRQLSWLVSINIDVQSRHCVHCLAGIISEDICLRGDLVVDNDIAVSSNILDCQIVFEVAGTRSRSEQNKTQDSRSSKARL